MAWRNSNLRYGSLSVSLHWLMLILLVAVYACMELRGYFPKGSDLRAALKVWHYMLGLSVLVLVAIRIYARFSGPLPAIEPAIPKWQAQSAKLLHLALYALMLGMPIAGWLILSADGKPIPFWGLELPPLVAPSHSLAESLEEWHGTGAEFGYWLAGLHAVAGLYHHYVRKDNSLTRILPGRGA